MLKKWLITFAALIALLVPVAAQGDAQVEIRLNTTSVTPGNPLIAEIWVTNGAAIAGADIAIAVDGTCLQVANMTPGDYLPSSAENGGFAPMNVYDETSARLAANVTSRDRVASGDGIFMTVQLNADCADQSSTIDVTRAELVTVEGDQFSADFVPVNLEIGSAEVASSPAAIVPSSNDNWILNAAIGLIAFGSIGLIGLIALFGFRYMRTRS